MQIPVLRRNIPCKTSRAIHSIAQFFGATFHSCHMRPQEFLYVGQLFIIDSETIDDAESKSKYANSFDYFNNNN